ncbi:hypothetical protein A1O7_04407 [Cladophialophora yegresii CBS 114405]|uniref:DUF7730 domain-containing protein n=1 Tax=Cladophialophora yegresii CBS 114405 TaxID=1182544 RepID=W9W5H8_9EURO|nr:uncharacterized protein A1O7_04407 [Cladophialophora yegresii CBS 114405]EXJ60255.1 hypothetical protein A1O7_04407 [Cladophialophora yegresii CBS 114405]
MTIPSQSDSPLLKLPSEIRNQIWHLVFADLHVIPSRSGPQLAQGGCRACTNIACTDVTTGTSTSDLLSWQEVFRPLRTCKQIYNEAQHILLSSFTLHLGSPLGDPMRSIVPHLARMKNDVRRLEWRVHILGDNRVDWIASIGIIGNLFPKLEQVVIHAHMRPPDSYEKLIDGIYVALPMVRLAKREMPNTPLSIDLAYIYSGVMFESPFMGEITTEDALEEHELVLKDVIADDEFITLALAPELDIQSMIAALLRCARAHEQAWFEKLQRKRIARLREMEAAQTQLAGLVGGMDEQPGGSRIP